MANQWYYRSASAELGPFAPSEMRRFAAKGVITPETQVRKGAEGQWGDAAQVKGLFAPQETATGPPPVPVERPPANLQSAKPPAELAVARAVASSKNGLRKKIAAIVAATVAGVLAGGAIAVVLFGRSNAPQQAAAISAPATSASKAAVSPSETAPSPSAGALSTTRAPIPERPLTTEEVVARCEGSVALIVGRRSSGTGFLAQPNLVATNKHIIAGESIDSVKVYFPSADEAHRGPATAKALYADPARDIAFLRVETDLKPLSLARNYRFRRGQEIVVIGNPGVHNELVLQNAISKGVMSTETTIDGQPYYQLGISINPGNSGGPVFDMAGHVIGVVTLRAVQEEALGFCIPVTAIQDAMERLEELGWEATTVAAKPTKPTSDELAARLQPKFADANRVDVRYCLRSLERLAADENLTTDEARAIREFGRDDEVIEPLVVKNLERTEDGRRERRERTLVVMPASEKSFVKLVETHVSGNPLETLHPQLVDFALSDGGPVLYDVIRDTAMVNPGPLTQQAVHLLHLSAAERFAFALSDVREKLLTLDYAKKIMGNERLRDSDLATIKAHGLLFLDRALEWYATPEHQAILDKTKPKRWSLWDLWAPQRKPAPTESQRGR